MKRLTINQHLAHKLALLGGVAALIVCILLTLQVRHAVQMLGGIDNALRGVDPSRALLEVVRLTQLHRALSAAVLGGKAEAEPLRAARESELDQAAQRFTAVLDQRRGSELLRNEWNQVTAEWRMLADAVARRQLSGADSMNRHSALIEAQIELHDRVVDHFGLSFGADVETRHLATAVLQHMPRLAELMGQLRVRTALMPAPPSAQDAAMRAALIERTRTRQRDLQLMLDKAAGAVRHAGGTVGMVAAQPAQPLQGLIDRARRDFLDTEWLARRSADALASGAAAIDASHALASDGSQLLATALRERRSAQLAQLAWLWGSLALLLALSLWLGLNVARSITGPATAARRHAEAAAVGDGIAIRTELLALSVAAQARQLERAQGRDAARLAAEVRSLAQRAAEAAREIKSRLGPGGERDLHGAGPVGHVGQALHEVVASVQRASALLGELVAAAGEAGSGLPLHGKAFGSMESTTRQPPALPQPGSAAAQRLQQRAAELVQAVQAWRQAQPPPQQ